MIKFSKRVFDVFIAPVDACKTQKQSLIYMSKVFNQWVVTTTKVERLRVERLKKLIAPLDDLIEDF
jgi:hypothetical protein